MWDINCINIAFSAILEIVDKSDIDLKVTKTVG